MTEGSKLRRIKIEFDILLPGQLKHETDEQVLDNVLETITNVHEASDILMEVTKSYE